MTKFASGICWTPRAKRYPSREDGSAAIWTLTANSSLRSSRTSKSSERRQHRSPHRHELREMPWERIVGMRNRLVHAYFDINLDILWETVRKDLPDLIAILELAVPPET